MRIKPLALSAAATMLWVAPAHATFHLEKVNEVMTASASGDTTVQFVELLDKGGVEEAFTPAFAPYQLVVYDAAGKVLGQQTLDPTGLRNAAMAGTEFLVSTAAADTALGVVGDARLTVAIPVDVAQVCFRGSPGNVSCIRFGPVAHPVAMSSQGTGAVQGPVPPNGESDQRQPDDTVQAAPPTPKATNRAGTPPAGGGGTPPPPGFAGVRPASRRARVDRHGTVGITLSCPSAAGGACRGRLTLTIGSKHAVIGRRSFTLPPGARRSVRVHLSRRARRAIAARGHLAAVATTVAQDDAGKPVTRSRRVVLS